MEELDWTGERLVTSLTSVHGTIEHLHRYALALELSKDRRVLDIACGEGYGSNLLSGIAKTVIGVDISNETIEHASLKYKRDNLSFIVGSTSSIPLEDSSIDIVVSFETIEHHDEHHKMMEEIRRVMKPEGVLIISSPEKSIYKSRDPDNPYHIKELSLLEFRELLKGYFSNVKIFDQRFVFGSLINETSSYGRFDFFDGDFNGITDRVECDNFYNRPFFNLAIVSNSIIPEITSASIFNGLKVLQHDRADFENIIKQKNSYIYSLENSIKALKKSYSYSLGNIILKPISFIKKIILNNKIK